MPTITLTTEVMAPIARCFDVARSVDCHVDSMRGSGERAVGGVTRGLVALGDEITWEARHVGVRQRLTSRITAFEPPRFFADEMVRGAFRSFRHEHRFEALGPERTRITDVFEFRAPLGLLGRIAERLVLTGYMRRQLEVRNRVLKEILESDRWRHYLTDASTGIAG